MDANYYISLIRGRDQTIELLGRQLRTIQEHEAEDRLRLEASDVEAIVGQLESAYCPDLSNLLVDAADTIKALALEQKSVSRLRFSERYKLWRTWSSGETTVTQEMHRAFDAGIRLTEERGSSDA